MSFFTFIVSLVLPLAQATTTFYSNTTVLTNITSACSSALVAEVNCDAVVSALVSGSYYSNSTLIRACTADCQNALSLYQANIEAVCAGDTWLGYDNETLPVIVIPEILNYHYNLTCLQDDESRFCNNAAASYAAHLDTNATTNNIPAMGLYGDIEITDPCDICLIKNLKFQAEHPYYDGPEIYSSSLYQSKTSSCGVTDMPLTTTAANIDISTTTAATTPTATSACNGTTYTVTSGDNCHSISSSMSIGTSWLLTDNDLKANCVDFPTSGALCLVNTCEVYTVTLNDTCSSIANTNNITQAQLKAWNPSIDAGCYNVDSMVDDQLCISNPGGTYVMPDSVTSASSASTTAAVPTDLATNTNTRCAMYYKTSLGDYCNMIIIKYGISLDDFLFLNPSVNANCTNLWADTSYCVEAVGDIETYSGMPAYVTATATYVSLAGDPATTWPSINYTTPSATALATSLPLATDTRSDCWQYFNGTKYIGRISSGSYLTSDCDLAAHVFDVTLEDLGVWNPSIGDTSLSNCSFTAGYQYCGQYWYGNQVVSSDTIDDSADLILRNGTLTSDGGCTNYFDFETEDDYDCASILSLYDITIAQFYAWNTDVKSDCSNLQSGYSYCVSNTVESDDNTATTTASTSASITGGVTSIVSATASPTAPAPTQPGEPSSCNSWYVAQSGQGCYDVATAAGISLDQLYEWNPALGDDCSALWLDEAYCVGVASSDIPTSTPTTASSPTTTSVTPPASTQSGIISTCDEYAIPESGQGCDTFYDSYDVTRAEFLAWNTAVTDCATDFWAGYAYCIGTSDT